MESMFANCGSLVSPSFTGRPFIEGSNPHYLPDLVRDCRRPLRDGLSLRVHPVLRLAGLAIVSPSFTGRPFIEGGGNRYREHRHDVGSPSFTGRPFIEGHRASAVVLGPFSEVAVLYGTAFH